MVYRLCTNLYRFSISFICLNTSDSEKLVSYRCVVLRGAERHANIVMKESRSAFHTN